MRPIRYQEVTIVNRAIDGLLSLSPSVKAPRKRPLDTFPADAERIMRLCGSVPYGMDVARAYRADGQSMLSVMARLYEELHGGLTMTWRQVHDALKRTRRSLLEAQHYENPRTKQRPDITLHKDTTAFQYLSNGATREQREEWAREERRITRKRRNVDTPTRIIPEPDSRCERCAQVGCCRAHYREVVAEPRRKSRYPVRGF